MREFFYHNRQWVYRIFPSLLYASWFLSSPLLPPFSLLCIVLLAICSAFCRRLTKGTAQTELLEELCRDVRRGHEPNQGWSSSFFLLIVLSADEFSRFFSGECPSDNIRGAIQSCSDCRGSPAFSQIQHCKTTSDFCFILEYFKL